MIRPNGEENQVRPPVPKYRTFTISWTEQSDMSSGWTYSDDATGLTAGDTAFDDFFGYSAVLLNTSGVETAEELQSAGVLDITKLGTLISGDNVMIKFPLRGIKMSKSGSVVTLSITDEPNKDGYQYYAFQKGQINNITDTKDQFYIGAYLGCLSSTKLKSWSGVGTYANLDQNSFCIYAGNNGNGYNIVGFYQMMYIWALYMMKYGNPNCKNVVGMGYPSSSSSIITGGTNSQTSATYGTSSNVQMKLFGIEDRWGNRMEWIGGTYTDSWGKLYTQLSGYSGATSGGVAVTSGALASGAGCISSILGNNEGMFAPNGAVTNTNFNTYYSNYKYLGFGRLMYAGAGGAASGGFYFYWNSTGARSSYVGARIMYL